MLKAIILSVLRPFIVGLIVGSAMTVLVIPVFCHWSLSVADITLKAEEWYDVMFLTTYFGAFLSIGWYDVLRLRKKVHHRVAGYRLSIIGIAISVGAGVCLCTLSAIGNNYAVETFGYYTYREFFTQFSGFAASSGYISVATYWIFLCIRYCLSPSKKTV